MGGKITVALPEMQGGPLSKELRFRLIREDQAVEIDRRDIFRRAKEAGFEGDFLKGFVVIQSNRELNVVAVYTAARDGAGVSTIEIERVPPRRSLGFGVLLPKPRSVPGKRRTQRRTRR